MLPEEVSIWFWQFLSLYGFSQPMAKYLSPYGFSQPITADGNISSYMASLSQWRYNLSLYRLSQSIAISQRMPLLLQPVATFWPMAISQPLWLLSAHGNVSATAFPTPPQFLQIGAPPETPNLRVFWQKQKTHDVAGAGSCQSQHPQHSTTHTELYGIRNRKRSR